MSDSFTITQQDDGNWIGERAWNGRTATVRDIDPQTVLTRLITHE